MGFGTSWTFVVVVTIMTILVIIKGFSYHNWITIILFINQIDRNIKQMFQIKNIVIE